MIQKIIDKINAWEQDADKNFFDYFSSNVDSPHFMFWVYGSGFITKSQFDNWYDAFKKKLPYSINLSDLLHGEAEWSILESAMKIKKNCALSHANYDWDLIERATKEECTYILASFIASNREYTKRLETFFKTM